MAHEFSSAKKVSAATFDPCQIIFIEGLLKTFIVTFKQQRWLISIFKDYVFQEMIRFFTRKIDLPCNLCSSSGDISLLVHSSSPDFCPLTDILTNKLFPHQMQILLVLINRALNLLFLRFYLFHHAFIIFLTLDNKQTHYYALTNHTVPSD